jgi:adenylate cyclase
MKNYNESILQCMATGVMTLDSEARVSSVNPAFCRMFDLVGDTVPTGVPLGQALGDAGNEALVGELARCAREGTRYTGYDVKYALASGDAVDVNLSAVPLLDRKHRSLGVVVVAEDITQEQRLMSTLCRYVTREIAEHVLKDRDSLRLGGSRQEVSILFADIRNFTTISEQHEPEEVVGLLNDYFSLMVQEIFAQQGTLDKFIGDAVMAVFGVPIRREDDALRAVRAAVGMRRALRRFNERQRAQGRLAIEIGIGVSHGEAISGNVGSEQRMEYTVIGDPVNVASRLEGLTKGTPYKILVNDSIHARVRDHFPCVLLGEEKVKGRDQPVRIYGIPDPTDS